MEKVSLRLLFDRKGVSSKQKQASVQIEVTFQKQRKYIATGIRLFAGQWDKKNSKVKSHLMMTDYNKQLQEQMIDLYRFVSELRERGESFSFEKIMSYANHSYIGDDDSFLKFMEDRIEIRAVSDGTKYRQRCVLKALREWNIIRSFGDINSKNIKAYDDFAKSRCKKQSSVYNYHKILKVFILEAMECQKISFNPAEFNLQMQLNSG